MVGAIKDGRSVWREYRGREIINDEEVVVMMQIIKNGEVLITRQVVR